MHQRYRAETAMRLAILDTSFEARVRVRVRVMVVVKVVRVRVKGGVMSQPQSLG